ncbi:hypothetical protein RJ639_039942, partial [Escallonia herrerae]
MFKSQRSPVGTIAPMPTSAGCSRTVFQFHAQDINVGLEEQRRQRRSRKITEKAPKEQLKFSLQRKFIHRKVKSNTPKTFLDEYERRLNAQFIAQMMWPLYLLFNKLLRTEERIVDESDKQLDSSESYSCRESLSCEKFNDVILPFSHFVAVPHVSQLHSWDCGLACVLMVLKTLGTSYCTIQELGQLCSTTSIWTVDLAYLLQKYSISFSYFTVTLGANPNFSVETFYKEQLPNDLERVDLLFKKALEAGINIECRSISGEEISLLILSGKYIAIALVDQYKLSQSWLQDVPISGFHSDSSGYTGHYIVICGYDAVTDEFEIRDPASSRKHDRVTSRCLEEARKSFGTDEDLVMISLEMGEIQNSPQ